MNSPKSLPLCPACRKGHLHVTTRNQVFRPRGVEVVVELLASSEGIGFLIVYGRQLFQLDVVLAAVVAVGVFGLVLDKALAAIETWLLRWRRTGL